MNYKQYIIKRQKGKHLTYAERNKIEAYLKVGKINQEIADIIGVSKRTIIREKKRHLLLQFTFLSNFKAFYLKSSFYML